MTLKEIIENRLKKNKEHHNLIHTTQQHLLELVTGKEDFDFNEDLIGSVEGSHFGIHIEEGVLKWVLREIGKEE